MQSEKQPEKARRERLPGDPWLISEAAHDLRVSPSTIRSWIAQKKLSAIRTGKIVRIPDAEIAAFKDRNRTPAEGAKP
jgi:excisionase family DNA binding protein